jgi:hypothetical protein
MNKTMGKRAGARHNMCESQMAMRQGFRRGQIMARIILGNLLFNVDPEMFSYNTSMLKK